MARYLITGGAGFIGSNLAIRLVQAGHAIRVLDNLSTGRLKNLEEFLQDIEFIEGDVRDPDAVRKVAAGVDIVFHQAALVSVPQSLENPLNAHEVNTTGTLNVLAAARAAGVRRVVYAASASVYGDDPALPKREQMLPVPLSPYAVSKLAGEYYLSYYCQTYGLEGLSLRYFNVFGPRQDPSSPYAGVIARFILALQREEPPVIYGDGEQSRDFTFVDDAVEANILAANCPNARGEVVNVACGRRHTLNDLVCRLQAIMGKSVPPCYTEPRAGDVRHSQADLTCAEAILGYQPRVDLDEGLRRTVEWFEDHHSDEG